MIRLAGTAVLAALPVFPGSATADPEAALLSLEGDVEYGAYLASECTGCHQATGANDGIPGIVGWEEDVFRLALFDYRTKAREHQAMNLIAGRLGDEEIAALSAFFAETN